MPTAEPSPGFKRLPRSTFLAARAGLSGGFAVISADLASWLAPPRYAWLAYALLGGTEQRHDQEEHRRHDKEMERWDRTLARFGRVPGT